MAVATPRAEASAAPRRWFQLSPRGYRVATFATLVSLTVIIETGALVRLTDSGLGCEDWPRCSTTRLVDVSTQHAAIEQLNRLFTGLVALAVMGTVLGSLVRVPRRRDLVYLSLGLVAGVIAQIVLGGVTVLVDLHPAAVQGHFLLSMAILADAIVLHRRAAEAPPPYRLTVSTGTRRHAVATAAVLALVLVTGTIVTGTGPHGGDEEAARFGFSITSVARLHSLTVLVVLSLVLWLAWRVRQTVPDDWPPLAEPLTGLFVVLVLQAVVGWTQYLSGVPVVLVAVHVAGAIGVWWAGWLLLLATRRPAAAPEEGITR